MIEERLINSLKAHPINERIYGDTYDHSLIKSIEEYGLRGTIEISKDSVVISGHRRWYVCQELGYETIPVTVLEETDPDKLIEYLITMNQATRERTREQIAREFEVLLEVEERKAKERQTDAGKQYGKNHPKEVQVNLPEPKKKGQARDKAAAKVGWSGSTAERAVNVVKYADSIEQKEPETAKDIKEVLNTKSVHAAQQTVKQHKEIAKQTPVKKLNATNDNIKWSKWSWNPVTGCLHDCPYCYARDIANRFDGNFKPAFHADRLQAPANTTIPEHRKNEPGINNIFVCSMADLFGKWVHPSWIEQVMDVCEEQPQWNYLFLTKNPDRYLEFHFPENCWLGASATNQRQFDKAIDVFTKIDGNIKFLSCEPLNERIVVEEFTHYETPTNELACIDWLIVGGRSKNSKMPAFQPEWVWVEELLMDARMVKIPVYFKTNLTVRPEEHPCLSK